MTRVMVSGSGDIGSAVALVLFRHGADVALLEGPQPAAIRRGVAFTDAVFDGHAELDGVTALQIADRGALVAILATRAAIPLVVAPLPEMAAVGQGLWIGVSRPISQAIA